MYNSRLSESTAANLSGDEDETSDCPFPFFIVAMISPSRTMIKQLTKCYSFPKNSKAVFRSNFCMFCLLLWFFMSANVSPIRMSIEIP